MVYYRQRLSRTIKRSHNEVEDEANIKAFLKDKKNLGEHQFVVESILNDIKPFVQDVEYNETPNILKTIIYIIYIQRSKPI